MAKYKTVKEIMIRDGADTSMLDLLERTEKGAVISYNLFLKADDVNRIFGTKATHQECRVILRPLQGDIFICEIMDSPEIDEDEWEEVKIATITFSEELLSQCLDCEQDSSEKLIFEGIDFEENIFTDDVDDLNAWDFVKKSYEYL